MEDLREYCPPGAVCEDHMVSVEDGIDLRVITFTPARDLGNPPVLFVAGWISQISGWKTVLKEMTKDFPVHYVETREKISSRIAGKADYGVTPVGEDIAKIVERLDLPPRRFVMFGSSLGATAIVDCYQSLKRKPLALALISPNATFRVPRIWMVIVTLFYPPLYALIRPPVKWYLKNFRLDVKVDHEQYAKYCNAIDAADPWKLRKAVLAVAKYQIWDRLEFVDVPTLLIGATKDVMHEPVNLAEISRRIRKIETIDMGTNKLTHSERVVEEMRSFLQRLSAL